MSVYKREKKIYYRSCVVEKDTVFDDILECDKFGWSWCEYKTGVHHTAILFYLDGKPRYTVNWSPKNGSKRKSILFETEGQLVFEDERLKGLASDEVSYMPCIETYDVVGIIHDEDDGRVDKFLDVVDELTKFRFTKYSNVDASGNARNYDVTSCNCRDHVISVMREVLPPGEELKRLLKAVQRVRWERISEAFLYGLAKIRGFFSFLLGSLVPLGIDIEKALSKCLGPDSEFVDLFRGARSSVMSFISTCSE